MLLWDKFLEYGNVLSGSGNDNEKKMRFYVFIRVTAKLETVVVLGIF